jgi:acetolactate synthase-1/2/3 large subunit
MQRMTTAEATIAALTRHGIDTLYALPGVQNDHLFDAAHGASDRMRVLHPRHEQTSAYMALGAALVTGRVQAYAAVPGPGILNTAAALLTAYGMGAPVMAIAGQIPQANIDRGFGHLHDTPDQLGILRRLTKFAERIRGPAEAPSLVADAIRAALSGRQRPVALECPADVWGERGVVLPVDPLSPFQPPVDEDQVERAAELLGRAERPVIFVGGGAIDAGPEVARVAEMLEAPVISFRRGRGVIPTTHPLAVSYTIGHRLWREADAVLAVGTRLFWPQDWWGVDQTLPIVRIDIDPDEPARYQRPAVAMVSDAAATLRVLADRLGRRNRLRPSRAEEIEGQQSWFAERLAEKEPQMGFLRALRAALPEDGIFVEEVTQVGFLTRLAWPVTQPRTFLSPGHQDTLGWGYGAALGAQAALPGRKVLAIAGDGGFLYQAGELATAAHHKLPVVVVVFDDGAFGNVRRIQAERYGNRLIASDLTNPDFVKYAESFGVPAFRATTPAALESALNEAFALNAPALVHVPVGEMPSPWDLILLPRVRGLEESWRRRPMP